MYFLSQKEPEWWGWVLGNPDGMPTSEVQSAIRTLLAIDTQPPPTPVPWQQTRKGSVANTS